VRRGFSPEQIAGVLLTPGAPIAISHGWIYRRIGQDRRQAAACTGTCAAGGRVGGGGRQV